MCFGFYLLAPYFSLFDSGLLTAIFYSVRVFFFFLLKYYCNNFQQKVPCNISSSQHLGADNQDKLTDILSTSFCWLWWHTCIVPGAGLEDELGG